MSQSHWEDRYAQPERVWSGKVNHWLRQTAAGMTPGTALDLACGEGGDAVWLASQGWRVTAVDFAAAALQRGARAAEAAGVADRIEWVQADLASGWDPGRTFDLVTMHFLHTPDRAVRATALHTAWAAARGTMLIVAHDPANLVEGTAGGPTDPAVLYGAGDVLQVLGLEPGDPQVRTAVARRRETPAGRWVDAVVVLQR